MKDDESQSVPIGLREFRDERVHQRLYVRLVFKVGETNKTVPQGKGNEGLFEGTKKEFQSARHDVNVQHGQMLQLSPA